MLEYSNQAADTFEFGVVETIRVNQEGTYVSRWEDLDRGVWCYVWHDDAGDFMCPLSREDIAELNLPL